MACEEYESSLIDAALGEPLSPEAEAHRRGCARCQAVLEEQRQLARVVDGVLESTAAVEPSADFLARVRRRVDRERVEDRSVWRTAAWATLAAILLGVVIGLWRRPVVPTQVADVPVTPTFVPTAAPRPTASTSPTEFPRRVRSPRAAVPRREPEVLIDRAAAAALARYAEAMRARKGVIAGSLDARVAAVEPPRYEGVLLESTAATWELPRVSVLTDLPRFERSEL